MPKHDLTPLPGKDQHISNSVATLIGVSVSVGQKQLIKSLSLSLATSGLTVILGPNGAGKSLLLRIFARLLAPSDGAIQIEPRFSDHTAIVFQRPVLLRRSVRANLSHALRAAGIRRHDRPARIDALLADVGLTGHAAKQARQLSGGEQQRLALARALATSPRLLLMDEPTASTDPHSTQVIETLIKTLARRGTKIVYVTHDIGQAQRLADEVIFIHRGEMLAYGPARQLLFSPEPGPIRDFIEGKLLV